MKVCFVVIVLAVALTAVPAQENYHGVAVAPNGLDAWIATIDTVAIFHTADFGEVWEHQEVLTIRDFFDIHFVDENKGWTCGRIGTIYHTTNGGTDWTRQSLGGPKFSTRIRFLNDTLGWSASGEAILLSTTDGGEFWEMTFFPEDPFPPDTVDFQGVWFVSPDRGWLVAGRYPTGDTFAGGQGYICRTTDAGDSWVLQRLDETNDFYDVGFRDADNGIVVGGNDQGMAAVVLRTTNGGTDWQSVPLPVEAKFLRGLAVVGNHAWACGRNGTVIHTSNSGVTWEMQHTIADTTLFDIEFADSLRGMTSGNSVVYATTDGGRHWDRVYGGVAEAPGHAPRQAARLSVAGNPTGSRVRFEVNGVSGGWQVMVYDATGRSVRTLAGAGRAGAVWDGLVETGTAAPPGIYLAQLEAEGRTETVRFVYLP